MLDDICIAYYDRRRLQRLLAQVAGVTGAGCSGYWRRLQWFLAQWLLAHAAVVTGTGCSGYWCRLQRSLSQVTAVTGAGYSSYWRLQWLLAQVTAVTISS